MGFYWDDWPWMFFSHILGPKSLIEIDLEHRPVSSLMLWLGAEFLGETPINWQLLALMLRWFTGFALWWALLKIWPSRVEKATWIAFIFLVFPSFTQQFVSVNSSRHLFAMVLFCFSLGVMVWSLRRLDWYWQLSFASMILALIGMLTSEYYYGLELVRPVVIWLVIQEKKRVGRLRTLFKYWAPYLLLTCLLFCWRYIISKDVNYQISVIDQLRANPQISIINLLTTIIQDMFEVSVVSWSQVFAFPSPDEFGTRKTFFYWGLVLVCASLVFVYLYKFRGDSDNKNWSKQAVGLGLWSLFWGGLPFLATGLEIKLAFPADRGTLPLMFGGSIFMIGLLDLFIKPRITKILLLSVFIGLAAGMHFQIAISYQRDWNYQVAFFRQLSWRIPGMREGSSLLTQELPIVYSTDNSLAAPLNWIYATDIPDNSMPYNIVYLDLRLGSSIPELKKGLIISRDYRILDFKGSLDDAIVIYHQPPGCLRVLDPKYDARYPQLPELLVEALPFSNLNQILVRPDEAARMPTKLFGSTPEVSWCYYFEKADLARQQGDWQQISELGDVAFQLDDSPNHASERIPFIQGYAFTDRWDRAVELTVETITINKSMEPMLCSIWGDVYKYTPPSNERENAIKDVKKWIDCSEFAEGG
jgi:hypothetical protein